MFALGQATEQETLRRLREQVILPVLPTRLDLVIPVQRRFQWRAMPLQSAIRNPQSAIQT